jgi:hypothetical protein
LLRAVNYRYPARNKGVTEIAVTGGWVTARDCVFMLIFFLAAHIPAASLSRFGHYNIHIVKGLHYQQAEIQYQYGGNEFHRVKATV